MTPRFRDCLRDIDPSFTTFETLETLQLNMGNVCNLSCAHCHIDASPLGERVMGREVIERIISFLSRTKGITLDITGGCAEMNPNFRYLVEATGDFSTRRMLRSNLTICTEAGMGWLPEFYRKNRLVIIASLPCYLEQNVDTQRGNGVYDRSIEVLKKLNKFGYGSELELNLVYNPGGDFIPGSQKGLEAAYKEELLKRHGIIFNNLYIITNAPIGRFRQQLEKNGRYERYLSLIASRFNSAAAKNIMCRSLISVDWQGFLYNCDFNQALGLTIKGSDGRPLTIDDLDEAAHKGKELVLAEHCFCCTAGEGSSCTGALAA